MRKNINSFSTLKKKKGLFSVKLNQIIFKLLTTFFFVAFVAKTKNHFEQLFENKQLFRFTVKVKSKQQIILTNKTKTNKTGTKNNYHFLLGLTT
jgi:hypothetical protein